MLKSSNGVETNLVTGFSQFFPNLIVKDSSIQGKGLFTDVELKKGAVLFEIVGEKIHHHYEPDSSSKNPNWIGSGYEEWLVIGPGDIALYLNHSCSPNVMINEKMQLVAMDCVKGGSELLLDYSTTELDPHWSMECSCGASGCRKVLRSFQYLPEALQQKYGEYISPVFIHTAAALLHNQPASLKMTESALSEK